MKKDVIFLVGFMGVGKTVIGKALARRLGFSFLDTDEMVEKKEGRSINRIFQESGEGYFREKEWEVLKSLKDLSRVVIATGGGLFLGSPHRKFIKEQGVSIWLNAPFEEILKRLRRSPIRPLFTNEEDLRGMLEKRKARYALADYEIETGHQNIEGIIERILKIIN